MKKLLIIDVQQGFVNENCNFVVSKIQRLVESGKFDKIFATKFVNNKNSQYAQILGYTAFSSGGGESELSIKLPAGAVIIEKTSYAMRETDFQKNFKKGDEVYVCGLDYDACVLATCFQLFDHSIQPKIILDATGSHSKKPIKKADFVKICLKNFGKNCFIEENLD